MFSFVIVNEFLFDMKLIYYLDPPYFYLLHNWNDSLVARKAFIFFPQL